MLTFAPPCKRTVSVSELMLFTTEPGAILSAVTAALANFCVVTDPSAIVVLLVPEAVPEFVLGVSGGIGANCGPSTRIANPMRG
jgi:hypothetical protein